MLEVKELVFVSPVSHKEHDISSSLFVDDVFKVCVPPSSPSKSLSVFNSSLAAAPSSSSHPAARVAVQAVERNSRLLQGRLTKLNMALRQDKSDSIVSFFGQGSYSATRHLFSEQPSALGRLSRSLLYLGTVARDDGSTLFEVRCRIKAAKRSFAALASFWSSDTPKNLKNQSSLLHS